jgi:hypothetical protein
LSFYEGVIVGDVKIEELEILSTDSTALHFYDFVCLVENYKLFQVVKGIPVLIIEVQFLY